MINRDEIVAELQRVARLLGKDYISLAEFKQHGLFGRHPVIDKFGSWNKALEAASLVPNEDRKRLDDSDLEREFRRVYDKLGKVPARKEFGLEARFSTRRYENRFGGWRKTILHYLGQEEAGLATKPPQHVEAMAAAQSMTRPRSPSPETSSGSGKRVFGPLLNFRGLQHAPVNEQGVVLLFGMVASELGFLVEGVGTGYPDCKAKRQVKGGNYVDVEIEFEFASSRFQHDPEKCDLIVCWVHDWSDCPIEVLELRSAIKQLPAK